MPRLFQKTMLVIMFGLSSVVLSDALPPQYNGYTISPYDNRIIKMKDEKVDIYWGNVCKVTGVFELVNPTEKTLFMKIGFPINISCMRPARDEPIDSINRIYNFKFELNGLELIESDLPERSNTDNWFGWTCALRPNLNIVKLTYFVKTNSSGDCWWKRNLHFVLNTGKFWYDKIDKAEIAIHFPENISKEQILKETSPPNYEILDKSMRWTFTAFEPTINDNIHLEIIDFKTFSNIIKYHGVLNDTSIDDNTKLEAAKFYASLAPVKGINFTGESRFDSAYYYKVVLPNLTPLEKKVFNSTYNLVKHGTVMFNNLNSSQAYIDFINDDYAQHIIKQALNRVGYYENKENSYALESKKIFREIVTHDPRNAVAWIAYITNDYLFDPEGCNPCTWGFGLRGGVGEGQKKLVKEAFVRCKNDPTIKLWNSFVSPEDAVLPDTIGKLDMKTSERPGIWIKTSRSGESCCGISLNELEVIKSKYSISIDKYLIINDNKIDNKTKNEIGPRRNFLGHFPDIILSEKEEVCSRKKECLVAMPVPRSESPREPRGRAEWARQRAAGQPLVSLMQSCVYFEDNRLMRFRGNMALAFMI